jgi:hypothetical protein
MKKNSKMKYCCVSLKHEIEEGSSFTKNKLIVYDAPMRCYGIIDTEAPKRIYQPIDYCPFCGTKFPKDVRNEYWQTIVEEVGPEYYPTDKNYDPQRLPPPEFRTDEWWRKRGL